MERFGQLVERPELAFWTGLDVVGNVGVHAIPPVSVRNLAVRAFPSSVSRPFVEFDNAALPVSRIIDNTA